ncbi:L-threonylcarbamoyladenylate synthase [Oryzifoliimicrobium ureilyticus]|uniref:L-threonylcarbamoyladenylate synthase n=1 Tax=Oryzifoliimicrobium ureilyticus TaxID=3113724 RepID=UPI0030765491
MAQRIDIKGQRQDAITAACSVLAAKRPVAMPTETVYGLAADATDPAAITNIYTTKGRPRFNPLICHMADITMAERYAVFDPLSRKLASAFWPGPLTLVLPLKEDSGIHPLATAGLDTVGLRVPKGFAGELIRAYGRPLAAPSANTSGKISPTTADHVEADLGDKIELILDGGMASVGVESTIIKVEGETIRLLRPGGLAVDEIERLTGISVTRNAGASATIEAPGMLASHYAPESDIRLDAREIGTQEALIDFGQSEIKNRDSALVVLNLSPSGNLAEAAANLFSMMKQADASKARGIAVAPIPDHGLGEAINDRLRRAAAPR